MSERPFGQPALSATPTEPVPVSSLAGNDQAQGHTPGPWEWFGNAKNHEIYLATRHSGRRYVMGFQRWGMRGGQPTFQPAERGLVAAENLLMFEVGDQSVRGVRQAQQDDSVYRMDIRGIDCADARLIAASPDMLTDLDWYADQLCEGWCEGSAEWAGFADCGGCRARCSAAKARGLPFASGIETEGQDRNGLGAQHESPAPQGETPNPSSQDTPHG